MPATQKAVSRRMTLHSPNTNATARLPSVTASILMSIAVLIVGTSTAASAPGGDPVAPATSPSVTANAAVIAMQRVDVLVPRTLRLPPFDVPRSLDVPSGFAIDVAARVPDARFMVVLPNRDILVSNPENGNITLVRPAE